MIPEKIEVVAFYSHDKHLIGWVESGGGNKWTERRQEEEREIHGRAKWRQQWSSDGGISGRGERGGTTVISEKT